MPNRATFTRDDIDRHSSNIALLEQQQRQQSGDISRLSDVLSSAAKEWQNNLANLQTQFRNELGAASKLLSDQIESLAGDLRKRDQINWQPYGILLSVLVVIGSLVYWPINREQNNQRDDINSVVTTMAANNKSTNDTITNLTNVMRTDFVSQKEYATSRVWAERERDRVNSEIIYFRDNVVPRGEHEQQWKTNDEKINNVIVQQRANYENLLAQITQLRTDYQRQIDEVKTAQGAVYGSRDVILAQGNKIEYLERQITDLLRIFGAKAISVPGAN